MSIEDKNIDINQVLKDLYVSMPREGYNTNEIYQYLIFRNVSYSDREKVLTNLYREPYEARTNNDMFTNWIDRFKNNYNIEVFCSEDWEYFCQFTNGFVNPSSCYKIYVPLDYEHIYDGVNRIFDFISDNNISHLSKVGKKIRFDDVVIRVNTEKDCKMILDFIDKDEYIKSGLMKCNSFAFNDNGVNVSYDGRTSYNCYLSCVIATYLNEIAEDKSKNVNDVSKESFDEYLKSMIESKNFNVINDFSGVDFSKEDKTLISNLMRLNLLSNNIDDYYKFMNMVNNNRIRNNIVYGTNYDISNIASGEKYSSEDIFKEVILYFMMSYGKDGYLYINKFLHGEYGVLMNNRELYNKVIHSKLDTNMCCDIAKNSNISTNKDAIMYNYVRKVMLDHIISSMDKKMGSNGMDNLNHYMSVGEKRYITRYNCARDLTNAFDNNDIIRFLTDINVDNIYDYVDMYSLDNKNNRYR